MTFNSPPGNPGGLFAFPLERSRRHGVMHRMGLPATNELQHPAPWSATVTPPYGAGLGPSHRYEIISELGGGGMSTVHLAHDSTTGHIVAIKRAADVAAALPDAPRRFAREASIASQLRHPNIVETLAIECDGDTPVAIVTEYVRGSSLRDMLATSGALPVDQAVRVLRDVAAALAYTHARHIVHRDVKPANILIESGSGRALLADFGIACEAGTAPDLDASGLTIGTPAYMAPEQIEARQVDERADVYALCIVGWEMLAGSMPWLGEPLAEVLHRQRYDSPPDLALLRPDIPVYLLNAINRGLSKDPARRWRDGAELLRQLSPTPTPLGVSRHGTAPLDATVQIATRRVEPATAAQQPVAQLHESSPRRRVRVLASTLVAVVLLALASLAPRLSRATERRAPIVDPQLDSMLTLAVTPQAPAGRTVAAPPCHSGSRRDRSRCNASLRTSSRSPSRASSHRWPSRVARARRR